MKNTGDPYICHVYIVYDHNIVSIVLRSNKRALPSGLAQIPVNQARELSLNASLCQITKTVPYICTCMCVPLYQRPRVQCIFSSSLQQDLSGLMPHKLRFQLFSVFYPWPFL